jgi:molybdate transport system substrate-binding protein
MAASSSTGARVIGRVVALLFALCVSACRPSDTAPPARGRALVVFAAASLREGLSAVAEDFERAHPGVDIQLGFAGTQALRAQLEQGAAADVFASADEAHMQALRTAGMVDAPVTFAQSALVVVVSSEAAERVRRFEDLPSATRIVLGAPEVPIGRYTARLLERADAALGPGFAERVAQRVVSRELNVRQVLAKVTMGEADAGVVYRSDAAAAGAAVHVLEVPPGLRVVAEYPMATLRRATEPALAEAWVRYVLSPPAQDTLAAAGFERARTQ